MPSFRLEWNDFSGGHYVGGIDQEQPRNTWEGTGATLSRDGAMLMPAAPLQATGISSTATGTTAQGGFGAVKCTSRYGGSGSVVTTRDVVCWAEYNIVVGPATSFQYGLVRTDLSNVNRQTFAYFDNGAGTKTGYQITGKPFATATAEEVATVYFPAYFWDTTTPANQKGKLIYAAMDNTAGAPWASVDLPFKPVGLERWKDVLVGIDTINGNRIYYSDVNNFLSWPTNNFLAIGDSTQIQCIVVFGDQFYVGKANGWYVVTGILGSSAVVRQMDATVGPMSPLVARSELGVLFERADHRVAMLTQVGQRQSIVNRQPVGVPVSSAGAITGGKNFRSPVNAAYRTVIAGSSGAGTIDSTKCSEIAAEAWVLIDGSWSKIDMPAGGVVSIRGSMDWARDCSHFPTGDLYAYCVVVSGGGAPTTTTIYKWRPHLADPPPADTSTEVRLAPQRMAGAGQNFLTFSVRKALVELEVPDAYEATSLTAATYPAPSFTLSVQQRGVTGADSYDGVTSQALTWTLPWETWGEQRARPLIELPLNTGHNGNEVVPIVTLAGCKLRRLVLVCEQGQME